MHADTHICVKGKESAVVTLKILDLTVKDFVVRAIKCTICVLHIRLTSRGDYNKSIMSFQIIYGYNKNIILY